MSTEKDPVDPLGHFSLFDDTKANSYRGPLFQYHDFNLKLSKTPVTQPSEMSSVTDQRPCRLGQDSLPIELRNREDSHIWTEHLNDLFGGHDDGKSSTAEVLFRHSN